MTVPAGGHVTTTVVDPATTTAVDPATTTAVGPVTTTAVGPVTTVPAGGTVVTTAAGGVTTTAVGPATKSLAGAALHREPAAMMSAEHQRVESLPGNQHRSLCAAPQHRSLLQSRRRKRSRQPRTTASRRSSPRRRRARGVKAAATLPGGLPWDREETTRGFLYEGPARHAMCNRCRPTVPTSFEMLFTCTVATSKR